MVCILAQVFQALEYPAEKAKQDYHRDRLVAERDNFIQFITDRNVNGSGFDSLEVLSKQLAVYEKVRHIIGADCLIGTRVQSALMDY